MIDHFVFLVEAATAERARILSADVNVVHVIEEIRLEAESEAANITVERLWMKWLRVKQVFLFVVAQGREWREDFAAERARILLALFHGIVGVLIADMQLEVFLNLELFPANSAREQFRFRHEFVLHSNVISESMLRWKDDSALALMDLSATTNPSWRVWLSRCLHHGDFFDFRIVDFDCELNFLLVAEVFTFFQSFHFVLNLLVHGFVECILKIFFDFAQLLVEENFGDFCDFLELRGVANIDNAFWADEGRDVRVFDDLKQRWS
jgi:hypothetical protein